MRDFIEEEPATKKLSQLGYSLDESLTMEKLAQLKGRFASPMARFCTTFLKLKPQLRWLKENLPTQEYERYVGVRRDESKARADLPAIEWDTYFDCPIHRPIAAWTKLEVFAYLKTRGEEINPLYLMGQNRVGCSPCHQRKKGEIREWAMRRPEEVQKVREAEKRVGRTFFAPVVPGKTMNWVDEVVAWANTERGGKISLLPMSQEETSSCSSSYGLCE